MAEDEKPKKKGGKRKIGKLSPTTELRFCPEGGERLNPGTQEGGPGSWQRQTKRYIWVVLVCATHGRFKYRTMKRAMGLPKPPKPEAQADSGEPEPS